MYFIQRKDGLYYAGTHSREIKWTDGKGWNSIQIQRYSGTEHFGVNYLKESIEYLTKAGHEVKEVKYDYPQRDSKTT